MDKLDLILEKLVDIESQMSSLNGRIDDLQNTMATKSDVEDIPYIRQAVMEIDERTRRLESNQAKLESVLSSLALHSMEQEADIRELKRAK